MYTIYSYWDMAEIQSVLNAVAMVSNSADFGSLLRVFALIGLLVAVTYGFVRARGEDAAAYLIIIAIWYVGLFLPKVTVTIEDRAPATGAPVQVANVPLGLAFFASTSSHIGAWLTETYETYFSLPDAELQFNKNGILFGSRILEEMRRSSVADPSLAQDLTSFVKNCVNPELLSDPTLMNSLVNEPDIWQFIVTGAAGGLFNPGLAVTVYDESAGSSRWVNCVDAVSGGGPLTPAESLNGRLTAAVAGEQNKLARLLNPGRTPASANALIASQIEAAETVMLTASRTAVQGIRQNMMINLMRDTSKTIPQLLNDPAAVQIATAESMAAASSNSSYLVMAKVAEGALPKIRNVIHLVVLAVFPILMLLLIMAGTKGGLVLRSYGITLLWVHLWPPLYAVVNYISTMAAAKSAVSTLGGIEGQTLATAATLASTVISDQAVAGLLTIAVPIMALALVKGGEVAMSGVVSSVMGPAQSAASRAGDSVGQGNISMGSTSWGTHTSNMMAMGKADTNMAYNSGAFSVGRGLATHRGDTSGAQAFDGSALGSNLGKVGGMLKNAIETSSAEQASQTYSKATDQAFSFAKGLQSIGSASKAYESYSGSSDGFRGSTSGRIAADISKGVSEMNRIGEQYSNQHGVSAKTATQVAMALQAAASAGPDVFGQVSAKASASLSAQGMGTDEVAKTMAAAKSIAADKGFQSQYNQTTQSVREGSENWDSSRGGKASNTYQAQLSDVARAESQTATSFKRAEAFDKVNREMKSTGSGVEASLASMYVDKYGSQAAENLARLPTGDQAAALQSFSRGAAQEMAEEFIAKSGAQPISPEQRALQGKVESQTPRDVTPGDAVTNTLEHHNGQLGLVPGDSNAPPVNKSGADLKNAADRTGGEVDSKTKAVQGEIDARGSVVYKNYDDAAKNAADPLSIVRGGTGTGSVNAMIDMAVGIGENGISLERLNRTNPESMTSEMLAFNRAQNYREDPEGRE